MIGTISAASSGVSSEASVPIMWCHASSDLQAAASARACPASSTPPDMCIPTLRPLSRSTWSYIPIVYFWSAAIVVSALIAWNPPAACQDEPAVSSVRSITATSVQPRSARW